MPAQEKIMMASLGATPMQIRSSGHIVTWPHAKVGIKIDINYRFYYLLPSIFNSIVTNYVACFLLTIGMKFVQGGCNGGHTQHTRQLVSGKERHGVRCCSKDGTKCTTPDPCHVHKKYHEAADICSNLGLRLCNDGDDLENLCCNTGCDLDFHTIWIDVQG